MAVKSTLFRFWQEQELAANRRITVAEVTRSTGISRTAIYRLLDGETNRFDAPVIDALCRYFGVPSGSPVPFLIYEQEDWLVLYSKHQDAYHVEKRSDYQEIGPADGNWQIIATAGSEEEAAHIAGERRAASAL